MKILIPILFAFALLSTPGHAGRSFVRASNQFIECSTASVTAYPITLSGWFKTDDLTVNQVVVANATSGTGVGVYLIVRGVTAGDPLSATDYDGSTSAQANSGGSLSTNTWYHGGAVFNGASSRDVFLNGTKTSNTTTTSTNLAGTDRTNIGALISTNSHFSGNLAEIAIWNVALTDAEMAILATGVSPLRVRPSALVFYAPIWSDIFDYVGNKSLVNQNSTSAVADHPIRYR